MYDHVNQSFGTSFSPDEDVFTCARMHAPTARSSTTHPRYPTKTCCNKHTHVRAGGWGYGGREGEKEGEGREGREGNNNLQ